MTSNTSAAAVSNSLLFNLTENLTVLVLSYCYSKTYFLEIYKHLIFYVKLCQCKTITL